MMSGGEWETYREGGGTNAERVLVNHLEVRGTDGRIILKWILQKYDEVARTGFLNGKKSGSCEQGNEPTGCTKC